MTHHRNLRSGEWPGTVTFRLTATNGAGSPRDDVVVTVQGR